MTEVVGRERMKVDRDLEWLLECLREVLAETESSELIPSLPWRTPDPPVQPLPDSDRMVQAYSICFQLLNQVEENAAAQLRRTVEDRDGLAQERGLWGQVLEQLLAQAESQERLAERLGQLRVEPVLTAHPTEAKRATVLEHYREIYLALVQRENPVWTTLEREALRELVKSALERLWRTGDIFLEKPDLPSELRNVIHYLRNVFPETLPVLDLRLQQIWASLGGDPELLDGSDRLPRLTFSTWVGGDRDGHPLVTAQVTREALAELRAHSLSLIRERLVGLARSLSLSDRLQSPKAELLQAVNRVADQCGEAGKAAVDRNPNEPWRQWVNLMLCRLPEKSAETFRYRRSQELDADLARLCGWLEEMGSRRLIRSDVEPVRRAVQTFGFHLAALDVRQNSGFHERAVRQLLTAAGFADPNYDTWPEERRLELLERELACPRPFVRPDFSAGPEAEAVLDCFRVLKSEWQENGTAGLGALIVSMTRSLSDLLVVYLFAREVGLWVETDLGPACPLQVVPLFETVDDLQGSSKVLRGFLEHRKTQAALTLQDGVQQVMVGYSDSNKDGGLIASLWGLYRAQASMVATAQDLGVKLRFFHGRGGTISRGAGPTGRFIRALPVGSLGGDLRLTEQGETVSQKYANRISAVYHLELLMAGTAVATLGQGSGPDCPSELLEPVLDRLAEWSWGRYRNLLDHPGFMTFFAQATPIDVIEQTRIGSRPARRTGRRSLADLRAIPWVFSWSQSRFFLSGWYGVGSALERLEREHAAEYRLLKEQFLHWPPVHYILSNAATSVMTACPQVMKMYSGLVQDSALGSEILDGILSEYDTTRRHLEVFYGGPLEVTRPHPAEALAKRRAPLLRLHERQVALLKQWRENPPSEEILGRLLLVVNAVAAGLRTTG